MRRYALVAVAAWAAALCVAPVASAVDATQTIAVKLSKAKAGTKKKPRSVGTLNVTTTTTPGPASPAGTFATQLATIFFDKNLVFNASKFKSCRAGIPSTPDRSTIDAKCKSSQVGGGSAVGQATIPAGVQETLNVKAFNGPAVNGKKGQRWFYLHVHGTTPVEINSVIAAKLMNARGPFGSKLVVPIPQSLQHPALSTITATLLSFSTTVGGTSRGAPYVGITGCSAGKLHFKGVFNFTDGTSKTATTTAKCRK